ncbi:hypothetical protein JW887_01975 [Candidatus Dojkabacteria bacterium]|nr:hypothetical protein [Candidatus Dojkabacteria bacterium]
MPNNKNNAKQFASTQDHLSIEKIVDNLVVMKDGTVALTLQTTAVNFDLLSEGEQEAKINAFAQLINSLTHSFQILIRTKKVNIRGYLDYIKNYQQRQNSAGLQRQITIYLNFVQNLIIKNEILDKKFFIIIPFKAILVTKTNPMKQFFGKKEKITNIDRILDQAKAYLYPKRDHIMKQLVRMGLSSHQLSTKELVESFFDLYNADLSSSFEHHESIAESQSQVATQFKKETNEPK